MQYVLECDNANHKENGSKPCLVLNLLQKIITNCTSAATRTGNRGGEDIIFFE